MIRVLDITKLIHSTVQEVDSGNLNIYVLCRSDLLKHISQVQ